MFWILNSLIRASLLLYPLLIYSVVSGEERSPSKHSKPEPSTHVLDQSNIDWQAQLYIERGLRTFEDNPHAGLPWLIEALKIENDRELSAQMHRIRINDMVQRLPRLVNFYTGLKSLESSPTGDYLAFIEGKQLSIYDFEQEKVTTVIEHSFPVTHAAFDQSANRIVTVCKHEEGLPLGRVWDVRSGGPLTEYVNLGDQKFGMKRVPKVRFSDDNSKLILEDVHSAGRWKVKGRFQLFDAKLFEPLGPPIAHQHEFDGGSYHEISSDGTRILFAAGLPATDERYTWEGKGDWPEATPPHQISLLTGELIHEPLPVHLNYYPQNYFAYSYDGQLIATGTQSKAQLWDGKTGELVHEWNFPAESGYAKVKFHPRESQLLISRDEESILFELENYQTIKRWQHGRLFMMSPRFQTVLYSDSYNSHATVAPLQNRLFEGFTLEEMWGYEFSTGEKYLCYRSLDDKESPFAFRAQYILDIKSEHLKFPPWRFEPVNYREPFSKDDRYLVTKDEYGLWIWDLEKREQEIHQLSLKDESSWSVTTASGDRNRLFTLDTTNKLFSWDTNRLKLNNDPLVVPNQITDGEPIKWFRMVSDQTGGYLVMLGGIANPLNDEADDEDELLPVIQLLNIANRSTVGEPILFDQHAHSYLQSAEFFIDAKQLTILEVATEQQNGGQTRKRSSHLHHVDLVSGVIERNVLEFADRVWAAKNSPATNRSLFVQVLTDEGAPSKWKSQLHFYDVDSKQVVYSQISEMSYQGPEVLMHPNERAVILSDGTIWNFETNKLFYEPSVTSRALQEPILFEKHNLYATLRTSDVATWRAPHIVTLHSLTDGLAASPPIIGSRSNSMQLDIYSDGQILALSDGHLQFWDILTSTPLTSQIDLTAQDRFYIEEIFFSPDQNKLIVLATDYELESETLLWLDAGDILNNLLSDKQLEAWSNILSARKVNAHQGISRVTQEEMIESYQTVRSATRKSD